MLLLVEPSAALRRALTRALYRDLDIATANDGEEGWEALNALPEIEVVVTELAMPLLDGHGLLARIRGSDSPRLRSVPVIILSDAEQTEARRRALQAGANDFLVKPADPVEVVARVELHRRLATALQELAEARTGLTEQTVIDPVTKLCNRRAFIDRANKELSLTLRHGTPMSLVLIAIDGLKAIGDEQGDDLVDEILAKIATWLMEGVRTEETIARVSGEEFVILAPRTGKRDALVMAERIRAGIAGLTMPIDAREFRATASVGVATLLEDPGMSLEELISLADRRLATARGNGGNAVGVGGACPAAAEHATSHSRAKRREPARVNAAAEDLLHQLVPLLEELTRQLGVREIITDLGMGGTANATDPAREDL
jgi:two-component system cell cycle response regulator